MNEITNEIKNEINNEEIIKLDNSFSSNSDFYLLDNPGNIELQKKKNLIQLKIINKNYEYKHFQDFCNSRKQVNGNVYLFSLDELEKLIDDFEKYHTPNPKHGTNNFSEFINKKQCKTIVKTILNDKNIKISICNPKEIKTSFYQQNYISYDVETDITKWKVNRRYSDFIWLRDSLMKFYPGIYCPPIPEKKAGPTRFEAKFIEKRRLFLNKFINDLAKIEIFKSSEILIDFLSIQDRNRFEKTKEIINSKNAPVILNENFSFSGYINLMEDNKKLDNYYNNIGKFLEMQTQILEEMKENLNLYYNNINNAYLNLCDIEKGFNLLNKLNIHYSVKEEITKTFCEFWRFFKNWKSIQYEENDIIKKHIKRFFKYISMENKSFIELINKRKEYKENYIDKSSKLKDKKEKLWNSKNINDWEIENINNDEKLLLVNNKEFAFDKMCTSESQNVNNLYDMLCYLNYNINEEFKLFINSQSKKFIINIKDFTEEFKNNLNKAVEAWSQIASLTITNN